MKTIQEKSEWHYGFGFGMIKGDINMTILIATICLIIGFVVGVLTGYELANFRI